MAKEPVSKPADDTDADKQLREALEAAGANNSAPGPEGSILQAEDVPGLDAVAGGAGGGGGVESVSNGLDAGGVAAPAVKTEDTNRRTVTVACKLPQGYDLGDGIVLKGSNSDGAERLGGFGLTENVDAEAFQRWLDAHPDNAAVRRGLIFAADNTDRARDQARERSGLTSGFEGIDPDKAPAGIQETDESRKERLKSQQG